MESIREIEKLIEGKGAKEAIKTLIDANIIPKRTIREVGIVHTYKKKLKSESRSNAAIDTSIEKDIDRATVYRVRKKYPKLWR